MKRWLVVCAVLLTGCAAEAPAPVPPPPTPTSTITVKEVPPRQLLVSGGVSLSYVHPETASRILCSPLTPPHQVFVRYEPDISGKARTCRIADQQATKVLELILKQPTSEEFTGNTKIAGRDVETYQDVGDTVVFRLPIADIRSTSEITNQWAILLAKAPRDSEQHARDYLERILPVLTKESDLIRFDPGRGLLIEPTGLMPEQFHDLAQPVQAEQLCTFVNQTLRYKTSYAGDSGCFYELPDGKRAYISADETGRTLAEYPTAFAGRPAVFDDRDVRVRLRDDVPVDLVFDLGQEPVGERVLAALKPK
ncbi:hypothetical protein LWC34_01120 [Kibdelosporangium philippinense]|uniref:DUF4825 domain-containing protein n=1 Tax=Kibdelosporangium philippinense TaxID=211113 RepID=A0ABS8Z268_9PSEU|nr:hypothetical protein [Kibdelosporangium philippinense]MCE7001447.1 hypothetical protein [Kibdelosporangium philippinense]